MDNQTVRGTCWIRKQMNGANGTKATQEIRTIRRPGGWEFDVAVPTEAKNGTKPNGFVRAIRWQGLEFEVVVLSSGPDL